MLLVYKSVNTGVLWVLFTFLGVYYLFTSWVTFLVWLYPFANKNTVQPLIPFLCELKHSCFFWGNKYFINYWYSIITVHFDTKKRSWISQWRSSLSFWSGQNVNLAYTMLFLLSRYLQWQISTKRHQKSTVLAINTFSLRCQTISVDNLSRREH